MEKENVNVQNELLKPLRAELDKAMAEFFDSEKACELSKNSKIKNKINLLTEDEFTDFINVIVSIKESCYNGENELLVGEDTQLHKCLTADIIEILKLKGFVVFKEYDRNVLYSPGPYLGYLIRW